ncbi:MAG: hypothetical protein LBT16_01190, partial [Treponema sp.]|nr:hypothetical protein [Treponema sp.]
YAPYRNNRATFYAGGFAGVAFSLIELSKALSVPAYEEAALILTEKIAADAKPVDFGVIWTGYSGPYHDGGTILYLLYAARHFNRPEWKELAAQGGRAIISTGETYGADQVWYKGFHNILAEFNGKDPEKESDFFPNFSYGTSGMTYVLARLYEETGDRDFLDAAEKGANYLISIAVPASQGRLIPYHYPDNREDVFFLGLCHGPVGSSRVFVLLHRLTKNPIYRDFYVELTQGIIGAGAPEYHSAGYWDCHCQCCGTAGFVNLFLGIWLESGGDEYLDYAVRSGKVLLGGATYDGEKAIWYQAFTRLKPDLITTDLGYMEGAAGIGVALLQLSTALGEDFTTIRLPDDPFATAGHRA